MWGRCPIIHEVRNPYIIVAVVVLEGIGRGVQCCHPRMVFSIPDVSFRGQRQGVHNERCSTSHHDRAQDRV